MTPYFCATCEIGVGNAGVDGADQEARTFARDHALGDARSGGRGRLGVDMHGLDRPAEHAALVIGLVDRHHHAAPVFGAGIGILPAGIRGDADDDRLLVLRHGARGLRAHSQGEHRSRKRCTQCEICPLCPPIPGLQRVQISRGWDRFLISAAPSRFLARSSWDGYRGKYRIFVRFIKISNLYSKASRICRRQRRDPRETAGKERRTSAHGE